MKLTFQKQNVQALLSQRNAWIGIAGLTALSTLILSVGVFYKEQKVILVPPHITKSFWVQGNEVSKTYLEEMGVYMSKLLLDLSPGNLDHNYGVLLRYATPEAHGALEKQFLGEAQDYRSLQMTTHFKPASVMANPQKLEVEVKGTLTTYVASKEIKTAQRTIFLKFTNRGSGLLLVQASPRTPADEGNQNNAQERKNHNEHF